MSFSSKKFKKSLSNTVKSKNAQSGTFKTLFFYDVKQAHSLMAIIKARTNYVFYIMNGGDQ